jgi:ubiquinone biosynthesis protein
VYAQPVSPEPSAVKEAVDLRQALISPKRFARMLARRGTLYIKAGQFLATRPDLLPQAYCDELLKLTDQVEPFAWREARQILTQDLGAEPETLFSRVNIRPIASASLSQVYLARTLDGDEVAIKVRRPGVETALPVQLRDARWLLRLLELSGGLPGVRGEDVHREMSAWLIEELDFRRELAKLTRMNAAYAGARFRVPKPYPDFSSERVLVTEYLQGVPFSELLRLARRGDSARIARFGFDPQALARNLVEALLEQIFRRRMFHGDPHPGNILAMEGDVVGFVDFGLVHLLDRTVQQKQSDYIEAVYRGDPEKIYRGLLDVMEVGDGTDLETFRSEVFEATRVWTRDAALNDAAAPGQGATALPHSPIAQYMVEVLRAARRNHLYLPSSALGMYRALLTADSVAGALGDPRALSRVGRAFFRRLRIERIVDQAMPDKAEAWTVELWTALMSAPESLGRLLADLSDDRFVFQVRTADSIEDRRDANLRVKLAGAAIVSVSLAVLLVGAMLRDAGPWVLGGLGAALAGAYGGVAVLWRRLK